MIPDEKPGLSFLDFSGSNSGLRRPHTALDAAAIDQKKTPRPYLTEAFQKSWRAQHDSNVRPSGPQPSCLPSRRWRSSARPAARPAHSELLLLRDFRRSSGIPAQVLSSRSGRSYSDRAPARVQVGDAVYRHVAERTSEYNPTGAEDACGRARARRARRPRRRPSARAAARRATPDRSRRRRSSSRHHEVELRRARRGELVQLLLRSVDVSKPRFSSIARARGCGAAFGRLPALNGRRRPPPR